MVAVRDVVFVLAAALTDTVPSFKPEDKETVSHEDSLLTCQLSLELMLNG